MFKHFFGDCFFFDELDEGAVHFDGAVAIDVGWVEKGMVLQLLEGVALVLVIVERTFEHVS